MLQWQFILLTFTSLLLVDKLATAPLEEDADEDLEDLVDDHIGYDTYERYKREEVDPDKLLWKNLPKIPKCPAGEYSVSKCRPCAVGYYKPSKARKLCGKCPEGKGTPGEGAKWCTKLCAEGKKLTFDTKKGADRVCADCEIGTYRPEPNVNFTCIPCPKSWTTKKEGSKNFSDCILICGLGMQPNSNKTGCEKCPAGTFARNVGPDMCQPCPRNKTTIEDGATAVGDCKPPCNPGKLYNKTSGKCDIKCPMGTYKDEYSSRWTECKQCPKNYVPNSKFAATGCDQFGTAALVKAGQSGSPDCGPGFEIDGNKCRACRFGRYKTTTGNTTCEECAGSKLTLATGADKSDHCHDFNFCAKPLIKDIESLYDVFEKKKGKSENLVDLMIHICSFGPNDTDVQLLERVVSRFPTCGVVGQLNLSDVEVAGKKYKKEDYFKIFQEAYQYGGLCNFVSCLDRSVPEIKKSKTWIRNDSCPSTEKKCFCGETYRALATSFHTNLRKCPALQFHHEFLEIDIGGKEMMDSLLDAENITSFCDLSNACASAFCGNGSCSSLPSGGFKCKCWFGYTGDHCLTPQPSEDETEPETTTSRSTPGVTESSCQPCTTPQTTTPRETPTPCPDPEPCPSTTPCPPAPTPPPCNCPTQTPTTPCPPTPPPCDCPTQTPTTCPPTPPPCDCPTQTPTTCPPTPPPCDCPTQTPTTCPPTPPPTTCDCPTQTSTTPYPPTPPPTPCDCPTQTSTTPCPTTTTSEPPVTHTDGTTSTSTSGTSSPSGTTHSSGTATETTRCQECDIEFLRALMFSGNDVCRSVAVTASLTDNETVYGSLHCYLGNNCSGAYLQEKAYLFREQIPGFDWHTYFDVIESLDAYCQSASHTSDTTTTTSSGTSSPSGTTPCPGTATETTKCQACDIEFLRALMFSGNDVCSEAVNGSLHCYLGNDCSGAYLQETTYLFSEHIPYMGLSWHTYFDVVNSHDTYCQSATHTEGTTTTTSSGTSSPSGTTHSQGTATGQTGVTGMLVPETSCKSSIDTSCANYGAACQEIFTNNWMCVCPVAAPTYDDLQQKCVWATSTDGMTTTPSSGTSSPSGTTHSSGTSTASSSGTSTPSGTTHSSGTTCATDTETTRCQACDLDFVEALISSDYDACSQTVVSKLQCYFSSGCSETYLQKRYTLYSSIIPDMEVPWYSYHDVKESLEALCSSDEPNDDTTVSSSKTSSTGASYPSSETTHSSGTTSATATDGSETPTITPSKSTGSTQTTTGQTRVTGMPIFGTSCKGSDECYNYGAVCQYEETVGMWVCVCPDNAPYFHEEKSSCVSGHDDTGPTTTSTHPTSTQDHSDTYTSDTSSPLSMSTEPSQPTTTTHLTDLQDECDIRKNDCPGSEKCVVDAITSRTFCTCVEYGRHPTTGDCMTYMDQMEFHEKERYCDPKAKQPCHDFQMDCTKNDTEDLHTCKCQPGYFLDGINTYCTREPSANLTSICDPNAPFPCEYEYETECKQSEESADYRCTCKEGFQPDDYGYCRRGNGSLYSQCFSNGTCRSNFVCDHGWCYCPEGYSSFDESTCDLADGETLGGHCYMWSTCFVEHSKCYTSYDNKQSSHYCKCLFGYQDSGENTCEKIPDKKEECQSDFTNCKSEENKECFSTHVQRDIRPEYIELCDCMADYKRTGVDKCELDPSSCGFCFHDFERVLYVFSWKHGCSQNMSEVMQCFTNNCNDEEFEMHREYLNMELFMYEYQTQSRADLLQTYFEYCAGSIIGKVCDSGACQIDNSYCDFGVSSATCRCRHSYTANFEASQCLSNHMAEHQCTENYDCDNVNGICLQHLCTCADGYEYNIYNQACSSMKYIGDECNIHLSTPCSAHTWWPRCEYDPKAGMSTCKCGSYGINATTEMCADHAARANEKCNIDSEEKCQYGAECDEESGLCKCKEGYIPDSYGYCTMGYTGVLDMPCNATAPYCIGANVKCNYGGCECFSEEYYRNSYDLTCYHISEEDGEIDSPCEHTMTCNDPSAKCEYITKSIRKCVCDYGYKTIGGACEKDTEMPDDCQFVPCNDENSECKYQDFYYEKRYLYRHFCVCKNGYGRTRPSEKCQPVNCDGCYEEFLKMDLNYFDTICRKELYSVLNCADQHECSEESNFARILSASVLQQYGLTDLDALKIILRGMCDGNTLDGPCDATNKCSQTLGLECISTNADMEDSCKCVKGFGEYSGTCIELYPEDSDEECDIRTNSCTDMKTCVLDGYTSKASCQCITHGRDILNGTCRGMGAMKNEPCDPEAINPCDDYSAECNRTDEITVPVCKCRKGYRLPTSGVGLCEWQKQAQLNEQCNPNADYPCMDDFQAECKRYGTTGEYRCQCKDDHQMDENSWCTKKKGLLYGNCNNELCNDPLVCKHGYCQCPENHTSFDHSTCVPAYGTTLGGHCKDYSWCFVEHSICDYESQTCHCIFGYKESEHNTCERISGMKEECLSDASNCRFTDNKECLSTNVKFGSKIQQKQLCECREGFKMVDGDNCEPDTSSCVYCYVKFETALNITSPKYGCSKNMSDAIQCFNENCYQQELDFYAMDLTSQLGIYHYVEDLVSAYNANCAGYIIEQPCDSTEMCHAPETVCDLSTSNNLCRCIQSFSANLEATQCLSDYLPDKHCTDQWECSNFNALCIGSVCVCPQGYPFDKYTQACESTRSLNDECNIHLSRPCNSHSWLPQCQYDPETDKSTCKCWSYGFNTTSQTCAENTAKANEPCNVNAASINDECTTGAKCDRDKNLCRCKDGYSVTFDGHCSFDPSSFGLLNQPCDATESCKGDNVICNASSICDCISSEYLQNQYDHTCYYSAEEDGSLNSPCEYSHVCFDNNTWCQYTYNGLHRCLCDYGYTAVNGLCWKIDDCYETPCIDENAECRGMEFYSAGRYDSRSYCICKPGYDRSGPTDKCQPANCDGCFLEFSNLTLHSHCQNELHSVIDCAREHGCSDESNFAKVLTSMQAANLNYLNLTSVDSLLSSFTEICGDVPVAEWGPEPIPDISVSCLEDSKCSGFNAKCSPLDWFCHCMADQVAWESKCVSADCGRCWEDLQIAVTGPSEQPNQHCSRDTRRAIDCFINNCDGNEFLRYSNEIDELMLPDGYYSSSVEELQWVYYSYMCENYFIDQPCSNEGSLCEISNSVCKRDHEYNLVCTCDDYFTSDTEGNCIPSSTSGDGTASESWGSQIPGTNCIANTECEQYNAKCSYDPSGFSSCRCSASQLLDGMMCRNGQCSDSNEETTCGHGCDTNDDCTNGQICCHDGPCGKHCVLPIFDSESCAFCLEEFHRLNLSTVLCQIGGYSVKECSSNAGCNEQTVFAEILTDPQLRQYDVLSFTNLDALGDSYQEACDGKVAGGPCLWHQDCDSAAGLFCDHPDGYPSENSRCQCVIGVADQFGRHCLDNGVTIDEGVYCQANYECSQYNALCDTLGTGQCHCSIFEQYNYADMRCMPTTDVNECMSGPTMCDSNAVCFHAAGSYFCLCNSGFTGSGYSCTDVDECASTETRCDSNAVCINTEGSYYCVCNAGFHGDGKTCADDGTASQSWGAQITGTTCWTDADCIMYNAKCPYGTTAESFCYCSANQLLDGMTCRDGDGTASQSWGAQIPGTTCWNDADCIMYNAKCAYGTTEENSCYCSANQLLDGMTCRDGRCPYSDEDTPCGNECHTSDQCDNGQLCCHTEICGERCVPPKFDSDSCAACLELFNSLDLSTHLCQIGGYSVSECSSDAGCNEQTVFAEILTAPQLLSYDNLLNFTDLDALGNSYEAECDGTVAGGPCRWHEEHGECDSSFGLFCDHPVGYPSENSRCQCLYGVPDHFGIVCLDTTTTINEGFICQHHSDCSHYNAYCSSSGYGTEGHCYCSITEPYIATEMMCQTTTDIDECASAGTVCDPNADCINTEGSFYCECNAGFTGDGYVCTEDNVPPGGFTRTIILMQFTPPFEHEQLFIRGGSTDCATATDLCDIPIVHRPNRTGDYYKKLNDWNVHDNFLDWYGAEQSQGLHNGEPAKGTPALRITDISDEEFMQYNTYGDMWLVDFYMSCDFLMDGWFELKGYVSTGPGANDEYWENHANVPFQNGCYDGPQTHLSYNHKAKCGMKNIFFFGVDECILEPIAEPIFVK